MVELVPTLSEHHLRWRNDKRIRLWTRQNGFISEEDHKRWLNGLVGDHSRKFFGIMVTNDSKLKVGGKLFEKKPTIVGTCGLTGMHPEQPYAEFSLLIGPEYQRKGYGKAALQELLRYGFDTLGLTYIWGETFEGNPAYGLFKSIGFEDCGCFHSKYFKFGSHINALLVEMTLKRYKEQSWR